MRSSNPVFSRIQRDTTYAMTAEATYGGIILKTVLLLVLAVISGGTVIALTYNGQLPLESLYGLLAGSAIVAFISVLIASISPRLARFFAIIYAVAEGVVLGFVTAIFEILFPGIAITAVIATATIFAVMLFLYSSRTIRVTSRFRKIMYTALFSILILSIIFGLLSVVAGPMVAGILDNMGLVLVISGVLIIFGALMLTLDFDRAEMIVESGADKSYEWVVSVGLMVTIIWIYFELLRFLAILAMRRD